MKTYKLLEYDFLRGLLRPVNLLPLLIPLAPCTVVYLYGREPGQAVSWLEYMTTLFAGSLPIPPGMSLRYVEIPVYWLAAVVSTAFLCVRYPVEDLSETGMQMLIRTGKRSAWFLSKCLWVLENSVLSMLLMMLSAACFTGLTGGSFAIQDKTALYTAVLLPFLVVYGLNQLCVTVTILASPLAGLAASVTLAVAAVYWDSPWIFPNCGMTLRNGEYGHPAWICLGAIAGGIALGAWFFRHWDILPGKREV